MTLSTKIFARRIEDFTCGRCGASVIGNGYTNHCPKCLWSKHVDINPGDRRETCGGMMKPIAIEGGSPAYTVVQKCEKCGIARKNKMEPDDGVDALLRIASST